MATQVVKDLQETLDNVIKELRPANDKCDDTMKFSTGWRRGWVERTIAPQLEEIELVHELLGRLPATRQQVANGTVVHELKRAIDDIWQMYEYIDMEYWAAAHMLFKRAFISLQLAQRQLEKLS